jgi:two-component system sensor histidine kinase VicK
VKVNVDETFKSINVMAITFILIGTALLIGVGLFAFIFARKLTKPLIRLSSVVSLLKPGNWNYHRSTKAKDEVGVLDHVISDMAARLKVSYENLEEEVRRRTEELRQQYLRDRTILETIEHGVVVVGCDSSIQDMNSGALKIIGKNKKEDVIGKNAEKIFPLAQRTRESIDEDHPIQNCLKTKKTYRSRPSDHLNLIMKNQEILPITLEATPLLQDDELIGAVVVIQDVTEERRVDYLKSEFISLASHQLRTPLSTIKWYMEIFEEEKSGNFTAVQIESLQEMTRATKRMSNMVETLLRAAQLEGKGTEVNKQNVNITEFIHDAGEELGNLAKDAKVSCKVDVPENPVEIYTDPLLLHIAFQNLFSNAVKYSKAGQSIHITLKEEADYILISVKDEGIGIPKSEQKRIFWRLFRAKNAIKTDTEGNGLGLYISKMVIDVLGGKIAFTSEEGKGTTFTVKLSKQ